MQRLLRIMVGNREVKVHGYDRNTAQEIVKSLGRDLRAEVEAGNKKTSYDTEHVHREAFDRAYKQNPGSRASLMGELRKQGYTGI
jgi:hypothetical protein